MLYFVVLLLSLLHKCFATENVVMLGRLTEAVDFNDLLKCETWKMEDSTINLPMNVTDDSEGAYKCEEDENTLLLLVYEVLEMSVTPEEGLMIEENLTLSCTLSTILKALNVTNTITLLDESGNKLRVGDPQEEIPELERVYTSSIVTFIPTKSGSLTYKCLWDFEVEVYGQHYKGSHQINKTLRIFVTARDARPDKTTVKVNESVTCSADGDPIPREFHWMCDTFSDEKDGWKATDAVIVFTHPKEYSCKCVASHLIHIRVHHSVWNGTIVVQPLTEPGGTKTGGAKTGGGKGGPVDKGGSGSNIGGKKDSTKTDVNAKNDDGDEDYDEDDEKDNAPEGKKKDSKRPAGSAATTTHAIITLVFLTSCFVAVATRK